MKKTNKDSLSLEKITGGELSKIFDELNSQGILFRCNFNQISKHFLSKFLPVNTFKIDYKELRDAFLDNINFDEQNKESPLEYEHELFSSFRVENIQLIKKVIKDENEFHRYICKTYLDLIKEPKEELLSAFVRARQDIKSIDETLDKIQSELDEITRNNITKEIQEKKPILYYYQEHNSKAKEGVLNFLKNDINNYALSNCYNNSLLSGLMKRVPYNYHWNPKSYEPRYPNDLENKFGELPYRDFQSLKKKYNEDKPSFHIYLTEYIKNEVIVFRTNSLLDEHHLLNVRKDIISEALNIYENGAKIMFANAVPTIIEGILHDLCLLNEVNENDLLQKGFQYKLDKLKDVLSYELYYEYYAFRFRLFRNKVAHGRLTKGDVDELSDLLLLDLYHICKLALSTKLKLNQKRFVIDELNKTISKPNYKYVFEYLLLDKIEIPRFYHLDFEIAEVEKIIVSNEFWEFLEKEMVSSGDSGKHGVYTILKIISSRKPFDKRCTKLFKIAGIKNVDKDLANNYIKDLTKIY